MTNRGRRRLEASHVRGASTVIAVLIVPVALAASVALSTQTVSAAPGTPAVAPTPGGGRSATNQTNQGAGNVPRSGNGLANSLNWAGYAVGGETVTSVTGSWVEPTAVCPGTKVEQSAFWIGIDGYAPTDPTVQQIGTDADCTKKVKKVPGGPSYYAWYQMFPQSLVVLPIATYPVSPGDVLSASVTVVGSSYALDLTDAGRWSYSTTQAAGAVVPLNVSGEWIAEAPTACVGTTCKVQPLTDFGSVTFTGATANGLPINGAGFTDYDITMTKTLKGKTVKASTSPLANAGSSFTVTWAHI
jgi:Peptidase A4 family